MDQGVGREVKRLREERSWSQAKLAVEAEMSVSGVSMIENGQRNLTTTTLAKLAGAFGLEIADLFPKSEAPLFPRSPSGEASEQRRSEAEDLARWLGLMAAVAHRMERWMEESDGPAADGAEMRARDVRTQEFVAEADAIRLWAPEHGELEEAEEWLARLKMEVWEKLEQDVEEFNAREGLRGADAAERYSLARDRERRKAGA
jgi:transcriptional regulator with XRE-family HTH domain